MAGRTRVPDGKQRRRVATGVYVKANGKFIATYRDPGHRQRWKEFRTKDEALKWRARAIVDPLSVVEGKRPLADVFDDVMRLGSNRLRPTTKANWRQVWDKHVAPELGHWPIGKITPRDLKEYFAQREGLGVGFATRQKIRMLLHRTFDEALDNGEIHANPLALGARGKRGIQNPNPRRARTLSLEEIAAVIEAARKLSPTEVVIIELMFFAGLRIGEVMGLQARDVNLSNHEVTVERSVSEARGRLYVGPTKSGRSRTLALDPEMQLWIDLADYVRKQGLIGSTFLFTGPRGANLRPNNWRRRVWYAILADAGIANAPSPHSGRRTAASRLAAAGVSTLVVKRVLGHGSSDVTSTYIDVSTEEIRRALRRAAEQASS